MSAKNNQPRKKRQRRARGDGAVAQLPSGRWYADLSFGYAGSRRIRKRVYGSTLREVQERRDKLRKTSGIAIASNPGTMTVAKLLKQWLEVAKASVSRGTFANYEQLADNLIIPKIGGVRLTQLNALHVQALYQALADDEKSAATQRRAGETLRVALSWAVQIGLLSDNAAKLATMPAHRNREIRALELEQIAAFLSAAKQDRLYALYALALDSGCRQGELLALNWQDVDFTRGALTISKSLEEVGGRLALKEPKSAKSKRAIVLSAFTLDALKEHRKAMLAEGSYRADGPMFCGLRSKTWIRKSDLYRRSFQPILKQAEVRFRFHDLRHSCASYLLVGGMDIMTVQERLGHSKASMTLNVYGHVLEGSQAEAAKRLNTILVNASQAAGKVAETA